MAHSKQGVRLLWSKGDALFIAFAFSQYADFHLTFS